MKLLQLIMKRPSDLQIRYGKVILGITLMLTGAIAFGIQFLQLKDSFWWIDLTDTRKLYMSHIIVFFGSIPIILWWLDIHFLSRGRARILQVLFGVFIFSLSGIFVRTPTLSVDVIYLILGTVTIIAGVTWKAITQKWKKQGQKITKIRV